MMKQLHTILLGLCVVYALNTEATAQVQTQPSAAAVLMNKLDIDKDGVISLKEAVRHTELLRNFGLIDENEDGKLSISELANSKLTPNNTDVAAKQ